MENDDNLAGKRLDVYVTEQLPGIGRTMASKLVTSGKVLVNGSMQTKSGYKLHTSDKVQIDYNPSHTIPTDSLNLTVLYEDNDCVVIDKPTGVLVHSKGAFNPEPTVATWLAEGRWQGVPGDRGGIVHRLDRATSGVMICAKTPEALSWLQKQFSQRKTKKTYSAVVSGKPSPSEAIIEMPIERDPKHPQTFRVGSNGKAAITAYKIVKGTEKTSLLELKPVTGRTHQLRVHLHQLGHPIVGDTLYGGRPADRLYLHAHNLELTLPNHKRKIFEVEVPSSFVELVA